MQQPEMNPERSFDKADRSERLAERRVTEVLRKLRLIGNLATSWRKKHFWAQSAPRPA